MTKLSLSADPFNFYLWLPNAKQPLTIPAHRGDIVHAITREWELRRVKGEPPPTIGTAGNPTIAMLEAMIRPLATRYPTGSAAQVEAQQRREEAAARRDAERLAVLEKKYGKQALATLADIEL